LLNGWPGTSARTAARRRAAAIASDLAAGFTSIHAEREIRPVKARQRASGDWPISRLQAGRIP